MSFDIKAFLSTLPVMAKGMGGIFIVTAVIIAAVYLIGKIPDSSDKNNKIS